MKKCPFCDTENTDSANVCIICGSDLPAATSGLVVGSGSVGIEVTDIGPNKIAVIKVIKEKLNCGLAEAKERCESGFICEGLTPMEADDLTAKLRGAGATVRRKGEGANAVTNVGAATGKYSVVISDVGADKIAVVKVVKEELLCTMTEAKEKCENGFVCEGLSKVEAEMIAAKLCEAGAKAEALSEDVNQPNTQNTQNKTDATQQPAKVSVGAVVALVIALISVISIIVSC